MSLKNNFNENNKILIENMLKNLSSMSIDIKKKKKFIMKLKKIKKKIKFLFQILIKILFQIYLKLNLILLIIL